MFLGTVGSRGIGGIFKDFEDIVLFQFRKGVCAGSGGISGIFRDFEDSVLFQFGKGVCAYSAVHAELLALREGPLVAAS